MQQPAFDIDSAASEWARSLARNAELEPGDIAELEGHLRDAIDAGIDQGLSPEQAFRTAAARIESGFEVALDQYRFRSATQEPRPKLFAAAWIPTILPNILKVTLRSFKRQPGYSLINVAGLAIGMAACLIIFLYVSDERSFDQFHEKSDRIYRIDQSNIWANFDGRFGSTGPGIAAILVNEVPEIESAVRVNDPADWLVTLQHNTGEVQHFEESRVLAADSTFYDVFTGDFLEGNADNSLSAPYSVILTESTRQRYFNGEPALGKSIRVGDPGDEVEYQVTGVVRDMPANSHFQFDLLASLSSNPNVQRRADTWVWTVFVTYIALKDGASIESVREKLPGIMAPHAEARLYSAFGTNEEELHASGRSWEMYLTPLTDVYLRSMGAGNRIGPSSNIFYIRVFSVIALLIIVLASINFMNLSTARSVYRAKEVGIRKTLGSHRSTLVFQFLSESVVFSITSLFVALGIVFVALKPFNSIAAKQLSMQDLATLPAATGIMAFTVLVGIVSGAYPAIFLTSFSPIQALRSRSRSLFKQKLSVIGFRNLLVVFQFVISIVLISCSVVIHQQLSFVQNKNLGFDKENVLVVENVERLGQQAESFKQFVANVPGVLAAAQSNAVPPEVWNEDFATVRGSGDGEISMNSLVVDDDLIETLGFDLIAGNLFEGATAANASYVVLNEAAVESLPWPVGAKESENFPIGQTILFGGLDVDYEVIGVLRNFNTYSLRSPIQPLGLFHSSSIVWAGPSRFLTVRTTNDANIRAVLSDIRERWTSLVGSIPFAYSFLDEELYAQYESEQRVATIVTVFTSLAIFIAILGLLGLLSFVIERRTKEIGVRKVLGASPSSIVVLLSRDMTILIIAASVVAVPIAWLLMDSWLQRFVYRVDINLLVFVAAGVIALLVAWATLSLKAVRAATRNPVLSLRSE